MKTMRALLALIMVMATATIASAQAVEFLLVSKQQTYTQTDNSTTTPTASPWRFWASIEGTNLAGIPTPTMTSPGGSTGSNTMIYESGDDAWIIDYNYSLQAELDAAYGNGDYSYTVHGQTVTPINISGNTFPAAPLATNLSGGTIVAGVLTWNVSQALTLTITGTADHMGIFVFGSDYNDGADGLGVGSITFTVPAFSLTAGQTYTVELGFDDIVGGTTPSVFGSGTGNMTGAEYAGTYGTQTEFTIQAVPEPSAYAAIISALALAGVVVLHRRRA